MSTRDVAGSPDLVPNRPEAPRLSIITVTLDDIEGLRRTIASVTEALSAAPGLAEKVEVVIKDGGSQDGTEAYLDTIDLPRLKVMSGADGGIYPAMNAALRAATGKWVLFLNAGDRLRDAGGLAGLMEVIDGAGDANFIYSDSFWGGGVFRQSLTLRFLTAHMINHQTICYRRDLLGAGYDTRYRFCADYAHLLSVFHRIRAEKLPAPLSIYDTTGVSSDRRNLPRMWRERLLAIWRSPLSAPKQLRLASRGLLMWPFHAVRVRFQ